MTDADDMAKQYYKMLTKLQSLHTKLATILLRFGVINQEQLNESFSQLLSYLPNIDSVVICDTSLLPTDDVQHFTNIYEVIDFLYTDDTKEITKISTLERTLPEINLLLIRKIRFYCDFLKQYLLNVKVPSRIVYECQDLNSYIDALHYVNRYHSTHIQLDNDDVLYKDMSNILDLYVLDDDDLFVRNGVIEIYEDGVLIYHDDVDNAINITPSTLGVHEYHVKYIPEQNADYHYKPSENTFYLQVLPSIIQIEVDIVNTNTYSEYYESEHQGYKGDSWNIQIATKNIYDEFLPFTPFNIYFEDTLLLSGETDALGYYNINDYNSSLCSSDVATIKEILYVPDDDGNLIEEDVTYKDTYLYIQTNIETNAYTNNRIPYLFNIYHHMFEVDEETLYHYIGEQTNHYVVFHLCDKRTGEYITENDDRLNTTLNIECNGLMQGINISNDQTWKYYINIDHFPTANDYPMYIYYGSHGEETHYETLHIISNFILPEQNKKYYAPTMPKIYYKPYGQNTNSTVTVDIIKDDATLYNDQTLNVADSLISFDNYLDMPGSYTIIITSNENDNINEVVEYNFTISNSMSLVQTSYQKTGCATYRATIYDKEAITEQATHITHDLYDIYNIQTPTDIEIEFSNDGYNAIIIDENNQHKIAIINKNENGKFDVYYNDTSHETQTNKNTYEWEKVKISINNDYKIYLNDNLIETIPIGNDDIQIAFLVVDGFYRNFSAIYTGIPISVTNNGNDVDYTYTMTETDNSYIYDIQICRLNNPNAQGYNEISVTVGENSITEGFELYDKMYDVISSDFKVGVNDIYIRYHDIDNGISLNSDGIIVNDITQLDDNIVVFNCDLYYAGPQTLTLTDDYGNAEYHTIDVAMGDYIIDLDMPEIKEYQDYTSIPLSIKNAFNREVNNFYCYFDDNTPINITKENNNIILEGTTIGRQFADLNMDTHTITIRVEQDPYNYNVTTLTKEFYIGVYISSLTDNPLLTDLNNDDDGYFVFDDMMITPTTTLNDLTAVMTDLDVNNIGELSITNFIASNPDLDTILLIDDDYTNIQDAIFSVSIDEEGNLKYDTIEK